MLKTSFKRAAVLGAVAMAIVLSGCGNRLPAAAPDLSGDEGTEAPAPVTSTAPTTPVASTPAYEQPTTPAVITGSLVVTGVNKAKKGLIGFRKVEVTGTIMNTSSVPLSGTLKIEFKESKGIINKRLEVIETKTQVVSNLAPGASQPFTIKSEKSCDDAEVTVETTQPAAAAGAAAANPYGAASAARPVANNPYGY